MVLYSIIVTVRLPLQVPIKNIERELICPSCKELFTHPLILPCQHSICHKCVRELLLINHEDSFDAGSECSLPGSPRSRVPSPSMERLDRLVRSGGYLGGNRNRLVDVGERFIGQEEAFGARRGRLCGFLVLPLPLHFNFCCRVCFYYLCPVLTAEAATPSDLKQACLHANTKLACDKGVRGWGER